MPVMASSSALQVQLLHPGAVAPSRGSAAAAGYDLAALMAGVVPARGRALLQTGVAIALPSDVYGRIAPRSGLSWKKGLDVGAGVIDADYRGELRVLLFNLTDDDVKSTSLLVPAGLFLCCVGCCFSSAVGVGGDVYPWWLQLPQTNQQLDFFHVHTRGLSIDLLFRHGVVFLSCHHACCFILCGSF